MIVQSIQFSRTALVILLLLVCGYSSNALADCGSQTEISSAECSTLVEIYQSTAGSSWINNTNWLNDSPCSWFGVDCVNNSVDRVYLADNGLTGTVPNPSGLGNVRLFNLDFNELTGPLPDLSGLTKLESASFVLNQFSGPVPAYMNLPALNYLNLSYNQLTGSPPESFAFLPALRTLLFNDNPLNGQLPAAYGNSGLQSLGFDTGDLCVADAELANWLAGIEVPITNVDFCWGLIAEVGDAQFSSGDTLSLFAGLQAPGLSEPLSLDLYLSLILPDGETEAFITVQNGIIDAVVASSDPSSWVPTLTEFQLDPNTDTGLLPIFNYPFGGSEPSGTYTWRFRATAPGSKSIILQTDSEFYFNPAISGMNISAAIQAAASSTVSFLLNLENDLPGATYHWEFDDGSVATGKQVEHQFTVPDRYLVKVATEIDGKILPNKSYHHINIGRVLEDTVYPLAGTDFAASSLENVDFSWNDCDPNWHVYQGKYFKLWIEDHANANTPRERIVGGLLFADYLFESYSEIFGWDYLPTVPALDIYICSAIAGGGTGASGTFLNTGDFQSPVGDSFDTHDFPDFVHEFIHTWDFRGAWLSSEDSAHALTGGMEPIISYLLGTGQGISSWGGDQNALQLFSPEFLFNHYFRVELKRYLKRPELNWSTYYSEAFQAIAYEDENIPENKEAMLVQGGLLVSLFNMHGQEGLRSIFLELEALLLDHPEWRDGVGYSINDPLIRAENFMKVVADALQLDVSDYFSYWKFPIASLDGYMSRYPLSSKMEDADGDGVSPLHGDRDDSDSSVYPYAPELVDGKDNNQDGLVDENVYTELTGDIGELQITLPAAIHASVSDNNDEDVFQFTLDEPAVVSVVMYSTDGDSTVPYSPNSNRNISIFNGTVFLDEQFYSELVHDAMSAPEALSAINLAAGTHALKINVSNPDGRNPNPGDYEIQLFVNDYEKQFTVSRLMDVLYPDQ